MPNCLCSKAQETCSKQCMKSVIEQKIECKSPTLPQPELKMFYFDLQSTESNDTNEHK